VEELDEALAALAVVFDVGQPESTPDPHGHVGRVVHVVEGDESHTVVEAISKLRGDLDGETRLPAPAWSGERHETTRGLIE
jgi:hypothetical protein